MHQDIQPTNEQVAVIDAVSSGNDLKVKAYAGAGKASTLKLVASRLSKKNGSYLAFNREIARGGLVRSDRISEFLSGIAVAIKLPILSLAAWRSMLHPASDRRGSNEAGFGYTSSGSCRMKHTSPRCQR